MLSFTIGDNNANNNGRAILKIKNISSNRRIIFKVKTTQPTWYFVKPSQDVIDIDDKKEIEIQIVESECR